MKKKYAYDVWIFFLFLVILLGVNSDLLMGKDSSGSKKPRLYIKFSGIGNTAKGGDFNDFIERNNVYYTSLNENPRFSTKISVPKNFLGFGGEIGLEVDKFAIGLSVGHFKKNYLLEYHYTASSGFENQYTWDTTFSAVPIFVMIHYKAIRTSFFTASVTLGNGAYLSRFKSDQKQTYKNHTITYANDLIESHKNQLGFFAGTTFDFNVTRNLAVFIEASYRWVQFKEMKANEIFQDDNRTLLRESDFYYWTGNIKNDARFDAGSTSNTDWNTRPAKFDLNGFAIQAGLKIIFGSFKKEKAKKIAPMD